MTRLSSPLQNLQDRYEIVVVGSGYGAAIAACRLARTGRSVCVLERGRELRPGEYPDTLSEAREELQVQLPDGRIGNKTALFDLRIGHDLSVLVGCGLGGTSLINANVALRAQPWVFGQEAWPQVLRSEAAENGLERYYLRAEQMLGCAPYPKEAPALRKLAAQQVSAQAIGRPLHRPPLAVHFRRGINHAGVPQAGCSLCGDCVTGCNYGAKNTTLVNYLPDAHHHGATIFTEIEVRYIERDPSGGGWRVGFAVLADSGEIVHPPFDSLGADVVVLAAGALGSTEILLRSQQRGLSLSDCVGSHFSGNADFVGFAYDCREPIHGVGAGAQSMRGREPVGPCISSYIDLRHHDLRREDAPQGGLIVEEGSIPGALASLLPIAFGLAADIEGQPAPASLWDRLKATLRAAQSDLFGAYTGAVKNTQTYLVMGHDSDRGHLRLLEDRLRVEWPGVGKSQLFSTISATLEQIARPLGGTYLKEPLWNRYTREQLITVHPLGGCAMAEDAAHGVVNHKGQVFSGPNGAQVHPGLYVMDGSTLPTPLGVNPLLTICALAERSCELLAADHGWVIDASLPSSPIVAADAAILGVQFNEQLMGSIAAAERGTAVPHLASGSDDTARIRLMLSVAADDLDSLLQNAGYMARVSGTATLPQICDRPLRICDGTFQIVRPDPSRPAVCVQRYRLPLSTPDGRRLLLLGNRTSDPTDLRGLFQSRTSLHCSLHDGLDEQADLWGQGLLQSSLASFAKQLATIRVLGAHAPEPRIHAIARVGCALAGPLFETYGSVVSEELPFHGGLPRKKRPLRVEPPQTHYIASADGVTLRLLRYRGGDNGPVLLVPGLGVSSQIFATDTIDTCLVEYLIEHGFDVWIFDPRTSIALPSACHAATADDVAQHDIPAAIAHVRAEAGVDSLQIVAHCFGGTALLMSLLKDEGLVGVRSVVLLQSAADFVVPLASELEAGLHLPHVLKDLGVSSLSADPGPGWAERLFDRILALRPRSLIEHDHNPVSRRITLLYGTLYALPKLNKQTYEHGLAELFGVANTAALDHVATLVSTGHLVDARGREAYMHRFADRLRLPITFLHGADNRRILPESSERTYRRLIQLHGSALYSRHVLPGYGHTDCILGKDAVRDVYPHILAALIPHADAPPRRAANQGA